MKSLKLVLSLGVCGVLFGASAYGRCESKNIADYPLRLHIFNRSETTFYSHHETDEAKGEGRANLFANGDVHGVDFSFDCSEKLKASFGFETYPAKWKKQDKELTVLLPVFGKAGTYFTCSIKTDVKDFAYTAHNGRMGTEPPEVYKTWMVKHEYDPEHGKNMPVRLESDQQPGPPPASAMPSAPPPPAGTTPPSTNP